FGSYQGLRQSGARGQAVTVETSAFRNFILTTRPNSIAAQVLKTYAPAGDPTTNLRDLGSPSNGVGAIGAADGILDVGTVNFSPTMLNEFRASVIRLRGGNDTPEHLDLPAIAITGITGFSYGQYPNGWRQTAYNYKNVLTFFRGGHTLKVGGEYRREFANNVN